MPTTGEGASPFLKWAGGKTQLLPELLRHAPLSYDRYIEPFVGGGALFFRLGPPQAILADANPELINAYVVVRDQVADLITLLETYPHEEGFYYRLRAAAPTDPLERAARLLYLNRTCYNGLYRVNRQGQFNVPFGRHRHLRIVHAERLRAASRALTGATLICSDYTEVLSHYGGPGDFMYIDPPYHPVSEYSDFKRYTAAQFRPDDQRRLAALVRDLARRGATVLASNSCCDFVLDLYAGCDIIPVTVRRNINQDPGGRTGAREVIIRAGRPPGGANLSPDPLHGQQTELPDRHLGDRG